MYEGPDGEMERANEGGIDRKTRSCLEEVVNPPAL